MTDQEASALEGLSVLRLHQFREKIALRQKLMSREVTTQAAGYGSFSAKQYHCLRHAEIYHSLELFCHTMIPYQLYLTLERQLSTATI
jgi:hypothetical protein